MILIIDNYDSFTYNIVQAIGGLDPAADVQVFRNDKIDAAGVAERRPERIIISPGPCTPLQAGVSNDVIRELAARVPILGVCLGHQCIAHVFGGEIVRARRVVHGKTSRIRHDGRGVFAGLSDPFEATRYHSLIVNPQRLPPDFEVCATAEDDPDEIMGMRHKTWPLHGVQFHPESFLTVEGPRLLANFLAIG
jgi:anthranilate synthase/aminodeoxychorismate synthase-like glutamine amidotransferase